MQTKNRESAESTAGKREPLVPALKILFLGLFLYMTWVVIDTSVRSNLIQEWDFLARIPWMTAPH